jgi:HNH endonuclease
VAARWASDPEYQANRTALLAEHPPCAIAGPKCTGRATTVDHIVARASGGDNSMANLRPACWHCNSHMGGKLGRARQIAMSFDGVLDQAGNPGSPDSDAFSPGTRTDPARSAPVLADIPRHGRHKPRLATVTVGDGSHGQAVTRWARRWMPNRPMRWNTTAWDLLLATDAGRLLNRQGLISVARQNSKTTAMEALAGWWCTDGTATFGGPQTVGWLSHDLKLTEQVFIFLSRLLEDRIVSKSFSFGRQRLHFDTGSTLIAQSNTTGAGHGWSFDCCIVDEAWRVKPEAINHGIIPAMRARPQPLLVMASTAGDWDSVLLRQWRERALTVIETGETSSMAFCEWSPPPGVDVNVARWWSWANPCLGTTVTRDTLLAEYQGPDRSAFLRGSLNVWVAAAESWLPPGQWEKCHAARFPELSGGVVAAEVSQAGDRYVAVHAASHNGVVYVQPLVVTEYQDRFWSAIDAVYGDIDRLAITPTLEWSLPAELARKRVIVGIRELATAVPTVRSMIAAGQIAHPGSQLFDEHVARAVATSKAGLSTAHSSGQIELARCLVWAAVLAARPALRRRPALATATG